MWSKIQCVVVMFALLGSAPVVFAEEQSGYIKHILINNTPKECYVSVRQQYAYPIDACLGPVVPKMTKSCDGSFELRQPIFFFDAICDGVKQKLEISKMVFLKNTYKSQSMEVTWKLGLDAKKKLKIDYVEVGM